MAEQTLTMSHSKVKTWRRCPKAYSYKYDDKLEKKVKGVALKRGSIIHDCIDAWIRRKSWKQVLKKAEEEQGKLFQEELEDYDLIAECKRMVEGYIKLYKPQREQYIESEIEFEVEIAEGLFVMGYIDGILEDETGIWIVEHKTHKDIPGEAFRMSDIQTLIYSYAVEEKLGLKISGVLWDYIRTKSPAQPDLLKSGELSKRANMDTTYAIYMAAIKLHGLDPKNYADHLKILRAREDRYYRQVRLPISKHMVGEVVEDLIITGSDILSAEGYRKPRHTDMHCDWCDFRVLCEVDVRGADSTFIKRRLYTKRTKDGRKKSKEKK